MSESKINAGKSKAIPVEEPEVVCGDCYHYNTNPQDVLQGFCRRFPPAVVSMIVAGPGGQAQTQIASTYPMVGIKFSACGEFELPEMGDNPIGDDNGNLSS